MRLKSSLKNSSIILLYFFVSLICSFISRTIFLSILGIEYNGLSSLFSNILNMLSIAELGIGSAIICHLYKPVAEDNVELIQSLMSFYKKAYCIIGSIISIGCVVCLPILPFVVGENTLPVNIYIVFILYALSSISSYLFTYNRSIIVANQKNYIITLCDLICKVLVTIVQIVVLYLTKNYYMYLIIQILFVIINNLMITYIAYMKYPFLKDKAINNLSVEILEDIKRKVKGLLFHKIATFIVLGTDNILISKLCGLFVVGLYSNYYMIIGNINLILGQIFGSITASIGNLIVTSEKKECYIVYKKMNLLQNLISTIICIGIFFVSTPFISLWIGEQYLLGRQVLFVILLNNYFQNNRRILSTFKEAAGIFHEDRFIPIIESIINLIASILLGMKFGLAGIFMGTIISTMIVYLYTYPFIVYKPLFEKNIWNYYKEVITHLILYLICFACSYFLCQALQVNSLLLQFVINIIVCMGTCLGIYYVVFRNTMEFQFYVDLLKKGFNKVFIRKKH